MACFKCYLIFSVILIGLFILFKLYVKLTTKWCTSKVCLVGKTIIVTGANRGIGYEAALEFAKRGARVILACRDESRAIEARDKIVLETGNRNVVAKLLDLGSLKSVKSFAHDVIETEERLDILVNNAGIGTAANKLTEDGLQFLTQINYLGPFLLTILLIDKLKKSSPSRIVNVSSILAAYSKLDVNNLNAHEGPYYPYSNSKLCNILFTMYLAKVLEKHNVTVYSLHPGGVSTNIFKKIRGLGKYIVHFLRFYFKTAEEGAQTVIYTAIEQGIEQHSGRHFYECRIVKTYATAKDLELPKKLWNKTVDLLKCHEEVKNL